MNLILSDVEETIMIVGDADGLPEGRATVNVSSIVAVNLRFPDAGSQ